MKPNDHDKSKKQRGKIDNEIAGLQQQIAELTEALKRERADAVNASRRHEDQLSSARNSAKTSLVRELLPVIDNLERALKHTPKELTGNDYVKGVEAVAKQFDKFLETIGVTKIKTVGAEFNPELHEAISMEEGDGQKEVVSEELQSGYRLGDQVVRHAMVRVKAQ